MTDTAPDATPLAFIDTETTGLDPRRRRIWELAVILADHHAESRTLTVTSRWCEFVHVDRQAMARAEPNALRLTGYHQRIAGQRIVAADAAAAYVAEATAGRHLVGAVPSFDERSLDDMLRAHGHCGAWHYHLIDVLALAAGWLAGAADAMEDCSATVTRDAAAYVAEAIAQQRTAAAPPWRSDDLTAELGVTITRDDRHTAMGDADWAMRTYAAVHDLTIVE